MGIHRKATVIIVVGLAVVILTAFAIGYRGAIRRQLDAWKLLPRPERFTELYFADAAHLPQTYQPNRPAAVAFTLHNVEGRTMTYRYQLVEESADGSHTQSLTQQQLSLAANKTQTISVAYTPLDFGDRAAFTIALTNPNQTIQYWARKVSTP